MSGDSQLEMKQVHVLRPPEELRRLQIEVTTHCNLLCEECSRTVALKQGKWVDKHMSTEEFERLIMNSPPADTLVLQGVGEPSLNPQIIEMTRFARQSGRFRYITLNTNAVTRSREFFQELRDAGLSYVCVSVDSLETEVANKCREGTKVDKLVQRIRELYADFGSVVVSMVVSKLNYFDLPRTLETLNRLGEEINPRDRFTVEMVPVIDYKPASSNLPRNTLSHDEIYRLRKIIEQLSPLLPRLILSLNAGILTRIKEGALCARPFFSPFITVSGFMTPCCTVFDPGIYQYTNLHNMTMAEAWVSDPVQKWLTDYREQRGNTICDGCVFKVE